MTYEKKRKMAEQPSKYSAANKALYFLLNQGGKIQEMSEVVETEIERLREAIKNLNALRRNDQRLTEEAEARIQELEKGLKAIQKANCICCYGADLARRALQHEEKE